METTIPNKKELKSFFRSATETLTNENKSTKLPNVIKLVEEKLGSKYNKEILKSAVQYLPFDLVRYDPEKGKITPLTAIAKSQTTTNLLSPPEVPKSQTPEVPKSQTTTNLLSPAKSQATTNLLSPPEVREVLKELLEHKKLPCKISDVKKAYKEKFGRNWKDNSRMAEWLNDNFPDIIVIKKVLLPDSSVETTLVFPKEEHGIIKEKKEERKPVSSNSNTYEVQKSQIAPISTEVLKMEVISSRELSIAKHVLTNSTKLAVHCERVHGKNGQICLIQIACELGVFVFDILNNTLKKETIAVLSEILSSLDKPKIFHDSTDHTEAFYHQLGITVAQVEDTQRMQMCLDKILGLKPVTFTLNELLSKYELANNPAKDKFSKVVRSTPDIWKQRPLTAEMIEYAATDVLSLLELKNRIYKELHNRIDQLWKKSEKDVVTESDVNSSQNKKVKFNKNWELVPIRSEENPTPICQLEIRMDLENLLKNLPKSISEKIRAFNNKEEIVDIVLDLGRVPVLRTTREETELSEVEISEKELQEVSKGFRFADDNRAGINGTLHRISAFKNRASEVIGLTIRIGRAVLGVAEYLQDIVHSKKSILFLGKPGSGKTTIIRDISRVSARLSKVVIVDTSNEIGGDGSIPHAAIGKARRMQVSNRNEQQKVLLEAVQNHTPDVIVIDEISFTEEVTAARTISQRGVTLIASAHGSFSSLLKNPVLCDLMGGIETVTIGDAAAKQNEGMKIKQQRRESAIFPVVIELSKEDKGMWTIYFDAEQCVDNILAKKPCKRQKRCINFETGEIQIHEESLTFE